MKRVKIIAVITVLICLGLIAYSPVKYVGSSDSITTIKRTIAQNNAKLRSIGSSTNSASIVATSSHGDNLDDNYTEWIGNGRELITNDESFQESTEAIVILASGDDSETLELPITIRWQIQRDYGRMGIEILAVLLIGGLIGFVSYSKD